MCTSRHVPLMCVALHFTAAILGVVFSSLHLTPLEQEKGERLLCPSSMTSFSDCLLSVDTHCPLKRRTSVNPLSYRPAHGSYCQHLRSLHLVVVIKGNRNVCQILPLSRQVGHPIIEVLLMLHRMWRRSLAVMKARHS